MPVTARTPSQAALLTDPGMAYTQTVVASVRSRSPPGGTAFDACRAVAWVHSEGMRLVLSTALLIGSLQAQVPLTDPGTPYTQTFDSLAASGTSSEVPEGWAFFETGVNANGLYSAGSGAANSGDTYSFGADPAGERAFGMLRSGSLVSTIGASFVNRTGATLTSLSIGYRGEQWRFGTVARGDRLDFQYSLDGAIWVDVDALDFVAPMRTAAGPVDGNSAAVPITATIGGLNIPDGAVFFLRWNDFDAIGADDGLAVDDFSLTASAEPANPSATATAMAASPGAVAVIAGVITPGVNPISTGLAVTCNLSAAGGPAAQPITVDGNSFRFSYTIPAALAVGVYSLPCTVRDAQSRMGAFNVTLPVTPVFTCGGPKTFIGAIQGSGNASPLAGQVVDIEAVVTADFQPLPMLGGFFVQEPSGDGDAATSDGIFVNDGGAGLEVRTGDLVRVRGLVSENFNQTVLTASDKRVCTTGNALPAPVDVTFPLPAVSFLERFEGMRVRFPQTLRVTDHFNLGRFNEVGLAWVPEPYTRLMTGTQVALPGAAANAVRDLNNRSRILLDDASNRSYGALAPGQTYPLTAGGLAALNPIRLGARVNADSPLVGVLGFDFNTYRVHPTAPVTFDAANPRPAAPPRVGGRVKVASANVLNYFTTFNSRGANNLAEFIRQRDKIIAGIQAMDAAIVVLGEIENNVNASLEDLVNDAGPSGPLGNSLNKDQPGKWAYIDTGVTGTDLIRMAFLYQPALVEPVGAHKVLTNAIDPRTIDGLNRPPVAQTFRVPGAAAKLQHFTVAANHFKSKGSACAGDPDLADGQDECNNTRISVAAALLDWLATNPTNDPTPAEDRRVLIVGDLNSYSMEDPIRALTDPAFFKPGSAVAAPNPKAVFTDLIPEGYSYLFNGESGALDHALANPALLRLITGAGEWHINADEPVVLDYNLDFGGNGSTQAKSEAQAAAYYSAGPFRTSDHDPLVIGFNPLAGDLNDDGAVSLIDAWILAWQIGKPVTASSRRMDYDGDGALTLADYLRWESYRQAYFQEAGAPVF